MINKLVLCFFMTINCLLAVLTNDKVVTTLNSRYEFIIADVECIGCIRIDLDFINNCVYKLGVNVTHGENLQRALIEHLEDTFDLTHGTKKYTNACNMVYNTAQEPETQFIDISVAGNHLCD